MEHTSTRKKINPQLIQRTCGGWLAVSPNNSELQLGVTGETESETREAFARTLNRWLEILATGRNYKRDMIAADIALPDPSQ